MVKEIKTSGVKGWEIADKYEGIWSLNMSNGALPVSVFWKMGIERMELLREAVK